MTLKLSSYWTEIKSQYFDRCHGIRLVSIILNSTMLSNWWVGVS